MKKIKTEIADVFLSDSDVDGGIDFFIASHLNIIFKDKANYREYCDLYARLNGLKPYALIVAHGDTVKGRWVYSDENREKSMQRWISAHDGDYGTLLLNSCNPGGVVPSSRKSLVWFPNSNMRLSNILFNKQSQSPFNFELFVPGSDIIDSYSIDYELEQLKKKQK